MHFDFGGLYMYLVGHGGFFFGILQLTQMCVCCCINFNIRPVNIKGKMFSHLCGWAK